VDSSGVNAGGIVAACDAGVVGAFIAWNVVTDTPAGVGEAMVRALLVEARGCQEDTWRKLSRHFFLQCTVRRGDILVIAMGVVGKRVVLKALSMRSRGDAVLISVIAEPLT
jgi:uncharacterized membrane protein YeaQ/YmgE (transglycosylase-associated protein family)